MGVDRVVGVSGGEHRGSRLLHRIDKGAAGHDEEERGGVSGRERPVSGMDRQQSSVRSRSTSEDRHGGGGDPRRGGGSGREAEGGAAGGGGSSSQNHQPLVVCRSKDEKFANPERLNLDRRKLTSCPVLEGEERLRLLNYQNNLITKVENLDNLPNLIFLDLYNNQLKQISALTMVTTLRVLMLGKNHLDRIEGLESLTRLDVLDLHSNNISEVEKLSHLPELRVLNLAGNQIATVRNLEGLVSLTELNLRRNQISQVLSLEVLPNLQRVFISNNLLASFESLQCLFMTKNLLELALDNNPVSLEAGYRQVVLDNLKGLRHLDLKRVTDEERRLASLQARKVEERIQNEMRREKAQEQRQEALRACSEEWEQACRQRAGRAPDILAWYETNLAVDGGSSKGCVHLHVNAPACVCAHAHNSRGA